MKNLKRFFMASLCILLVAATAFADNRGQEPAFDAVAGWEMECYYKDRGSTVQIAEDEGRNAVMMVSEAQNHVTARKKVSVEKNAVYKITAEVKTEDVSDSGRGACIGIYNRLCYSDTVRGTSGGYVPLELYVRPQTSEIEVMLSLGGHGEESSGTAFFRNPQMLKLEDEEVPGNATVWQISDDEEQKKAKNEDKSYLPETNLDAAWYTLIAFLIFAVLGAFYYVWFKKQ